MNTERRIDRFVSAGKAVRREPLGSACVLSLEKV